MSDLAPYTRLQPGQLWFAPDSVGGLLRVGMSDDARAILEVAAADQGLSLTAMIERDYARLQSQWLRSYSFDCPVGTWRGRFDYRRQGKKRGFLHCGFSDLDSGQRYALTVFANNHYRPRHAGPNFEREALFGQNFRLTTAKSKSGYVNLIHAELDTGEESAGSWAMAPVKPSAAPARPQTPPKPAILAAFKASVPRIRPPRL